MTDVGVFTPDAGVALVPAALLPGPSRGATVARPATSVRNDVMLLTTAA